jgi:hypothetical protein
MDDLMLVGVHDDGEHVLLTGPDGRRFRLRVDDALRAAVRRDRARLGQLQIELDGKLRPRDIQARIRAGHTPEEIADEAKVPLAYVRRYEGPVLAEREHVAGQARGAVLRRGQGGDPTTLAQVVVERLSRRGVDPDAIRWDSWRSEDGSWMVAADYPADSADGEGAPHRPRATWSFDQANRHVTALDDAARLLSADQEAAPVATGPRRLAPVQGFEMDAPSAWLDLPDPVAGNGGAGSVAGHQSAGHQSAGHQSAGHQSAGHQSANGAADLSASPVDLLDTLRERRGRRTRPLTGDEEEPPGSDPVREAIDSLLERSEGPSAGTPGDPARNHPSGRGSGRRPGRQSRPSRNGRPAGAGSGRAADPTDLAEDPAPDPAPDVLVVPGPDPVLATAVPHDDDTGHEHAAAARKRGRASVPSWDDIVFGSRRE